jgi:hypothetical protein
MNQYRCETCKHHDATRFDGIIYFGECKKIGMHPLPLVKNEIYNFPFGLCCHSDFQSERDKVLDDFMNKIVSSRFELDEEIVVRITDVRIIREELRAGEP